MQLARFLLRQLPPQASHTFKARLSAGLTLAIALIAVLFVAAPLSAQTSSGTLTGVVSDPGAAVVPGAAITAKNTATGELRQTVSNGSGVFSIPALPRSLYGGRVREGL